MGSKKEIVVQLTMISIVISLTFFVWMFMLYFFGFSLLDILLLYFKIIPEPLDKTTQWIIHISGFLLGLLSSFRGIKKIKEINQSQKYFIK